jgi:hypothetical protein
MILRFLSLMSGLIVAAALPAIAQNRPLAPAQTRLPAPSTPPSAHIAPTPAPLAPPTNPAPAVAPPDGLSPLLSQPGPISPGPRADPSYPAATYPSPLGQQQMQSYRSDLLSQRWQLEQQGREPRQRALSRAAAAAQPAELTLADPDHPRFPGASSRVSSRSGSRFPLSRAFLQRSA